MPRREVAVVGGALMLVVFVLGFVIEDQGWGLPGTMLAGFALIVAATLLAALTLILLERRRERR
jgi:hypothetical protein